MATKRRTPFHWARRPNTERRVHARVRGDFPVELRLTPNEPPIFMMASDIGLGGIRAVLPRYLELFSRFELALELPIADAHSDDEIQRLQASVAVVRIEPDEEMEDGTEYDVSLSFTRIDEDAKRVIATFMLQRLLYDPNAELI